MNERGLEITHSGRMVENADRRLERRIALIHRDAERNTVVGELLVVVDLWPLTVAAVERLLPLLVALVVVISVLGVIFFVLFERAITRHLIVIARYLSDLSLDKLYKPLAPKIYCCFYAFMAAATIGCRWTRFVVSPRW